jgi:hypothetical protein
VVGEGRFLVIADDEGGLTCVNRVSRAMLWSLQAHRTTACGVRAVASGRAERVVSIGAYGDCVVVDPATGRVVDVWRAPACESEIAHRHAFDVSWDREHIVVSCLEALPPKLVAVTDAVAAQGIVVHVHDPGGPVVVADSAGLELGRAEELQRPFAAGASTRVAYLRAPDHWVGVRDLVIGDEVEACPHFYERGGYAVAISPDEKWVAWSGYEKYGARIEDREFVRLVEVSKSEEHGYNLLTGPAEFTHLVFSPTGDVLLAGDNEGAVTAIALDGSERPRTLGVVDDSIAGLAFADPGTVVALGVEGEFCTWSVRS